MKTLSFLCRNLEATEFLTIVVVLSTPRLTQIYHVLSYLSNFSSIKEKIHAATAPPSADVKHMSRKCQLTVLVRLMSKILTQKGFIFSTSVLFDPLVPTEKG